MKRLILIVSLLVTGCQAVDWQPYAALYPTAAATPTPTKQARQDPTPQGINPRSCIVTAAQSLNLRADAGTVYKVIDWLAAGDVLTRTGNERGAWIEVTTSAGRRGWVHSRYCKNEVTK